MKKHEKVLKQIADWNAAHPEGTVVDLTVGDIDPGVVVRTKTRSVAWGLGDTDKPHVAVVLVDGKRGGWELDRVKAVPGGVVPEPAAPVESPYCYVCGDKVQVASSERGVLLGCGTRVSQNGFRGGDCVNAKRVARENVELLRRCRPLLQFVAVQPDLSNELRPLVTEAARLGAEIDKLPKASS